MGNLGSALGELRTTDLFDLPVRAVGGEILELLQARAELEAEIVRRVTHFDLHNGSSLDAIGSTTTWLVAHGRMARGEAATVTSAARVFARGELPRTAAAFADGRVGLDHVRSLLRAAKGLPAELVAEAEPTLVESAERLDPYRLDKAVTYFRHRVDAERFAKDSRLRDESRGLDAATILDGVVAVRGTLTPLAGAALLTFLDAAAQKAGKDDPRTATQRRHDALYDLLRTALDSELLPEMGGAKPHVVVHVPEQTLQAAFAYAGRGLSEDALRGMDIAPAVLERTGAVLDLPTLCRLAGDCVLIRAVLRGPSELLELGRKVRTATAAQRTALAVRDGGCIVPGCGRPPKWCEAHHIVAWEDGGATDLSNLCLLCRYHHSLMSRGWSVGGSPGAFTVHRSDGTILRAPPMHLLN